MLASIRYLSPTLCIKINTLICSVLSSLHDHWEILWSTAVIGLLVIGHHHLETVTGHDLFFCACYNIGWQMVDHWWQSMAGSSVLYGNCGCCWLWRSSHVFVLHSCTSGILLAFCSCKLDTVADTFRMVHVMDFNIILPLGETWLEVKRLVYNLVSQQCLSKLLHNGPFEKYFWKLFCCVFSS